jgi:hypothetical protein
MYPPNDRATCALAKILMDFHSGMTMHLRYPPAVNAEWVLSADQEVVRELSARIRRGC